MNWVGGSRNRLVMRNDSKKQREFFEKRKMQQKLKNMGISLPSPSPGDAGSGNVDIMTLFIVNQIAAKKGCKDPPKVAVLSSCKGGVRRKRKEPLVLPMSPCSPSQLCLVEGQPEYSVQGSRKRKNVIPQGFKCQQLSPLLESGFSDNSASDYQPAVPDLPSPFSSTSSASLGQGIFPLQLNLQKQSQTPHHPSPAPWDTSVLLQTKAFYPFSQPRCMTNTSPWSCKANETFFQLETPTASQVFFSSPEQGKTKTGDCVRYEETFSLNQPKDKESMLDFMLNQSETQQQFEEDVFRGFSNEECERESQSHSESAKSKIYLTDQTSVKSSTPQTVPDSECMGAELSNYSDTSFSCPGHDTGPLNDSEYSPCYSCRGDYLSSDSDDDEDCCQPCLPASASYTDPAFSANTLNVSQGNLKQRFSELNPHTPQTRVEMDLRDYLKVTEKMTTPDKACGSKGREKKSSTAAPHPPAQTQSSDVCKCKKTSSETRDAGIQTVYTPRAEACDASTQCSFVSDSALGFSLNLPNADMSEQLPATGRQADTATEPDALTASTENSRSEEKQTPWNKKKSKEDSLSGRSMIPANNCDKVMLQRPTNCFLNAESTGQENKEGRDEREQHESCPPMRNFSDQRRGEGASATRVNMLSEEAETLQEIADILLLLKQRKIQG
ncbi:uncharacterized protein redic1 [Archocentrus centrarchus]|uniref:uncharacterized protein redic1 n=1 Tax=Archocentrus centrarchus TaxID=63155 RepID=UPI0011E9B7C6|nr:uncharacterized protein C12orf40 homolog [Archocentrus centrarchus]